ncbi:lhfp-4 [Pristionchus pacificus]|uniref:Uncharacterized protein n=1 Tax=Pristionchus pacificus TaxID=54126 RepID=A0A2A6B547_PRIPA|nr:lhfp-4 [Pristionchus pacificus]|eukprot:PDM61000.1 hypothetical protein PRIPAC_54806 [Pristionchus pacificus]
MARSGLTFIGVLWMIVSCLATALLAGGIIIPEWLIGSVSANGKTVLAFFGAYKRCNYPIFDEESSMIALVEECGRYSSFFVVPSLYWQLTIILVVTGTSLSMLLSFLIIPSLCTQHVINASSAIIVGFFQIVAAICVSAGLVVYPLGWDNAEVRGSCGRDADRYDLGSCRIGRAFLAMIAGVGLLVFSAILSICGGKSDRSYSRHTPPEKRSVVLTQAEHTVIRGYDGNGQSVVCMRPA